MGAPTAPHLPFLLASGGLEATGQRLLCPLTPGLGDGSGILGGCPFFAGRRYHPLPPDAGVLWTWKAQGKSVTWLEVASVPSPPTPGS